LSAELAAAEAENTQLIERNESLAREVVALQAGTEAVEKNARENLGLIKEGEVYYQFVEEPDAP
jgi:cell division protein FtsB